jgi:hypothetical protein
MQFWPTFTRYLQWSLGFLWMIPFRFVTIALLIALPLSLWFSRHSLRDWKPVHWILFLQFALVPTQLAIAVLGAVPAVPWPRQEPHAWATLASTIVSWRCLLFGVACVWRMKGLRRVAIIALLSCQWLMQGVGIISVSALTGVWP